MKSAQRHFLQLDLYSIGIYAFYTSPTEKSFPGRPGDFRSWESPQTLPVLFIGPLEHVERFRNLKFVVKRITNIQSTVLSSSEGTAAIHLTFK